VFGFLFSKFEVPFLAFPLSTTARGGDESQVNPNHYTELFTFQ